MKKNNLDYIIRSHEVKDMGYEVAHGGKCITVFSAPNYCGMQTSIIKKNRFNFHVLIFFSPDTMGNKGAYIVLNGKEMKPQYEVYEAVSHPNGNYS